MIPEAERHRDTQLLRDNIPEELRTRPQWVVWKMERRGDKDTKVPYSTRRAGRASATDSMTWATFEEALDALDTGRYQGVGFVFTSGDPYAGVDLDNCRDPETGDLEWWAGMVEDSLDGYTEVSPSGTGLHIIVRGEAPNKKRGDVEAYSSERYFTMTGRGDPVAIPERTEPLAELIHEYLTDPEPERKAQPAASTRPPTFSDEEVLTLCRRAKNAAKFEALYDAGDTAAHDGDDSAADLALLGVLRFYTRDPEQLERLLDASALGQRQKWRTRPDYRQRTIQKALSGLSEAYEAPRTPNAKEHHPLSTPDEGSREFDQIICSSATRPPGLAGRVKLGERITGGVEPPEQIVEGLIYAGRIHALNSEPGEGKTTAALWAAAEVVRQGRPVLYLDAENGPGVIAERLQGLGATVEDLDRFLHYHPSPELTLDADSLTDLAATAEEVEPALVVFDSLPDFLALAGLNENDAGDVTRWILAVVQPLKDRGAAVILLDHVTKSTEGRGRYARGSGAKLAKCDVVWSLTQKVPFGRDRVGELRLAIRKDRDAFMPRLANFAVGGTPDGFMFRRADGVVEVPGADDGLTESQRTALEDLQTRAGEEGLKYSDWKAGTGLADSTFDRARDALIRLGKVSSIKQRYHALNPQPSLYPHGGKKGYPRGGSRGGNSQEGAGVDEPRSGGGKKGDTYAEFSNPHLPPHDPRGGSGGSVQNRTPANPHTLIRGGGAGGWTGGAAGSAPPELARYLAKPPEGLVRQAEKCAREGGVDSRLFKPLVVSVAYEVFGTAAGRCEQVRPAVEAWMYELQERARDA